MPARAAARVETIEKVYDQPRFRGPTPRRRPTRGVRPLQHRRAICDLLPAAVRCGEGAGKDTPGGITSAACRSISCGQMIGEGKSLFGGHSRSMFCFRPAEPTFLLCYLPNPEDCGTGCPVVCGTAIPDPSESLVTAHFWNTVTSARSTLATQHPVKYVLIPFLGPMRTSLACTTCREIGARLRQSHSSLHSAALSGLPHAS